MGETLLTACLVWAAVVCAIGAVIGHCSTPTPPAPPRLVVLHRARRDLWIVDHRPLADELRQIRR